MICKWRPRGVSIEDRDRPDPSFPVTLSSTVLLLAGFGVETDMLFSQLSKGAGPIDGACDIPDSWGADHGSDIMRCDSITLIQSSF